MSVLAPSVLLSMDILKLPIPALAERIQKELLKQTRLAQELRHTSPLFSCRFDPSGRFVFAGAQDNTIHRWELATSHRVGLVGHRSWIRALAFLPARFMFLSVLAFNIVGDTLRALTDPRPGAL